MSDAMSIVQTEMLTQRVTLAEYETIQSVLDLNTQRPEVLDRINERRSLLSNLMQKDDELWEWSHGPDFGAIGGLAVCRKGSVVKAWQDWRS